MCGAQVGLQVRGPVQVLDPVAVGLSDEQAIDVRRVAARWRVAVLTLTTLPPPSPHPDVLVKGHFTLDELWGRIESRLSDDQASDENQH